MGIPKGPISSQDKRSDEERIRDLINIGLSPENARIYYEFSTQPIRQIVPSSLPVEAFNGVGIMLSQNVRDTIEHEEYFRGNSLANHQLWKELAARNVPGIDVMLYEKYKNLEDERKFPTQFKGMPIVYSWGGRFRFFSE